MKNRYLLHLQTILKLNNTTNKYIMKHLLLLILTSSSLLTKAQRLEIGDANLYITETTYIIDTYRFNEESDRAFVKKNNIKSIKQSNDCYADEKNGKFVNLEDCEETLSVTTDDKGNLETLKIDKDKIVYTYNDANQLIGLKETQEDDYTEEYLYAYHSNGKISLVKGYSESKLKFEFRFEYSNNNLLVIQYYKSIGDNSGKTWAPSTYTERTVYTYDDQKRLIGEITYREDKIEKETEVNYTDGGLFIEKKKKEGLQYTYVSEESFQFDERGNRTAHFYYDYKGKLEKKYFYYYNEANDIEKVEKLAYDWEYYNGLQSKTTYRYKNSNITDETFLWIPSNRETVTTYEYKFDKKGNWVEKVEIIGNSSDPKKVSPRQIKYN